MFRPGQGFVQLLKRAVKTLSLNVACDRILPPTQKQLTRPQSPDCGCIASVLDTRSHSATDSLECSDRTRTVQQKIKCRNLDGKPFAAFEQQRLNKDKVLHQGTFTSSPSMPASTTSVRHTSHLSTDLTCALHNFTSFTGRDEFGLSPSCCCRRLGRLGRLGKSCCSLRIEPVLKTPSCV